MTTAELVTRVQRLDRLYLAMCAAQDRYLAEPIAVNYRRWVFYERRYRALVAAYDESA